MQPLWFTIESERNLENHYTSEYELQYRIKTALFAKGVLFKENIRRARRRNEPAAGLPDLVGFIGNHFH